MIRLTKNFPLQEMIASDTARRLNISNEPNRRVLLNLMRLTSCLEVVREAVAFRKGYICPIIVTSGYRSPELNKAIGGSRTSAHCLGLAADLRCPQITPFELATIIAGTINNYDQVILEFDSWVHLGLRASSNPRMQKLTAVKRNGKTHYKSGLHHA